MTRKPLTWVLAGILVVAMAVTAAVLLRQDVAVSQASQASDIVFSDGGGNVAGYSSATIGSSGASATLTLTGVAGAANLQLTDLLTITNTDNTQSYSITLKRSAAPPAGVSALTFTVLKSGTSVASFDAVSAASASAFTLAAGEVVKLNVDMSILDGTSPATLGSMDLQFEIAPV